MHSSTCPGHACWPSPTRDRNGILPAAWCALPLCPVAWTVLRTCRVWPPSAQLQSAPRPVDPNTWQSKTRSTQKQHSVAMRCRQHYEVNGSIQCAAYRPKHTTSSQHHAQSSCTQSVCSIITCARTPTHTRIKHAVLPTPTYVCVASHGLHRCSQFPQSPAK